jgi:phosphatidylglycerophosphate synthase
MKIKKHDQWIKQFYRWVGYYLCRLLARTSVLPNHLTLSRIVCAAGATVLIVFQIYPLDLAAAVLIFFFSMLDAADGTLATMKDHRSYAGGWLDYQIDRLGLMMLFTGCGLRFWWQYHSPWLGLLPLVVLLWAWFRAAMHESVLNRDKYAQFRSVLAPDPSDSNADPAARAGSGAAAPSSRKPIWRRIASGVWMQLAPHTHNLALYFMIGLIVGQLLAAIVFTGLLVILWWTVLNWRVLRLARGLDRAGGPSPDRTGRDGLT